MNLKTCKVFDAQGQGGLTSWVIGAIDAAIARHNDVTKTSNNSVISMSLSLLGFSSPLNNAVQNAVDNGLLVVAAAGNQGVDACTRSPASSNASLIVGALTNTDEKYWSSNWGTCVDVFAPGGK